ncbi:MAG: magnesium transporter [Planctomycetota bacterium]|jgi:magnesium transporter
MTLGNEATHLYFDGKVASDRVLPETVFRWMEVDREQSKWREEVDGALGTKIHEEHAQDVMNHQHPPFFDECGGYALLIFPDLQVETSEFSFVSEAVVAFISPEALVTFRSNQSTFGGTARKSITSGSVNLPRSSLGLLIRLMTEAADKFLLVLPHAQADMENFRRRVLDPADRVSDWPKMYERRAVYRQLRNIARQFEDALDNWHENTELHFDDKTNSRFSNLMEHLRRATNELREYEAEVDSLVELHFAVTAHQTNETVRFLTVLSSIFMPLTFIAGIFGMNFVNMPELQAQYGYPIALGFMVTIAVVLAVVFRKKGWF